MTDAVIVGIVPAIVEAAKRAGLPVKYAGIAAILVATAIVALIDLSAGSGSTGSYARWFLGGLIHGLAGVGLYSQAQRLPAVQSNRHSDRSPNVIPTEVEESRALGFDD